jgi:hypothetical protein
VKEQTEVKWLVYLATIVLLILGDPLNTLVLQALIILVHHQLMIHLA